MNYRIQVKNRACGMIRRTETKKLNFIRHYLLSDGSSNFGDFANNTIVDHAAPYEMFANYIKENTPFDMTFVISCCNGAHGYIPAQMPTITDATKAIPAILHGKPVSILHGPSYLCWSSKSNRA